MNAENPDPRSTREFSSGSQVAAFTSRRKIYWKMLKNILKNHCKIDEKSMRKRVDFWTDLLIDFRKVFGRVLGAILASKSIKKRSKNQAKICSIIRWFFERKCLPNGRPGGSRKDTKREQKLKGKGRPLPGAPKASK